MRRITDLAALIARHAPQEGMAATAVPGLSLIRSDRPTVPVPAVYEASLCLIAQGSKRVSIADRSVVYDASRYLLVSVDLPLIGHILEASAETPYLRCKIDLDMTMLADLLVSEGRTEKSDLPALAVYSGDADLTDAASRLVALLETPANIATLAPLIEQEILYRLLTGPHGVMLRHIASTGSHLNQITRAIAAIRGGFRERLRIKDVAEAAGMSPSSLHAHFKTITRMTPLEYQKQLRLQEARQLMLAEGVSAGSAGFSVGYDSPSQFSREYRRLFGAPPQQDIERLQNAGAYLQAV
ncbi:AraC family transcriptional regulator [Pacificimonas flava]|uniref:Transcriptional regulator, AraC family n=1 Tax=Pacificimonas flava TaxID=1234595 RepID=M2U305_9SPHN|nr:AraC family transcriptional regulator [Pacificimonas flava]EMD82263.1 Transcriptional regulator, AraC family [Pacificimonas flava]MBB5280828.1 AraC-like DNA-binding protein [Pacificimonas flava]